MNRSSLVVLTGILAGCGHSLWPTSTVVIPVAVPATFSCADSVTKGLGYRPFQSKPTEGFLRTRKSVTDGSTDIFDLQPYDQLRIEIAAAPEGGGSTLSVTAESYTEQVSRRGRDQTEKSARPAVIADARAVLEACGAARQERPDRVPSVN
jgi:hypothetical protein